MNITEVRVRLVKSEEGKLKGVASVTIDDCFVVHDVKIIEGADDFFIAMPSKKNAFRRVQRCCTSAQYGNAGNVAQSRTGRIRKGEKTGGRTSGIIFPIRAQTFWDTTKKSSRNREDSFVVFFTVYRTLRCRYLIFANKNRCNTNW